MTIKKTPRKCPECNGTLDIIDDRGEIACRECGLILEDAMVVFDKTKDYDEEENIKSGTGLPYSYRFSDQGLYTRVGAPEDFKKLSPGQKRKMHTFNKIQHWAKPAVERNLDLAISMIKTNISQLKLTVIIEEEACRLYTILVQHDIHRGRPIEHLATGAIYVAGRLHQIPISMLQISMATNISKKEIAKSVKLITRGLKINLSPQDPIDFIARMVAHLNCSQKVQSVAVELLQRTIAAGENLSGMGPLGIAAATVYLACILEEEWRPQREVAEQAFITEVTLRNRFKQLTEILKLGKLEKHKYFNKKV